MRASRFAAALVAVLAVGALTACDPAGLPVPGPNSSNASEAPQPSPGDEGPGDQVEITRMLVGTETVAFGDDSGFGVASFSYDSDAGDAVNILKTVFGPDPIITDTAAGMESPAHRSYDWGGFELQEMLGELGFPPYKRLNVSVSVASLDGVAIYGGAESVQVGAPMSAAIAIEGGHGDWPGSYQSWVDPVPVDPASVGESGGAELLIFVAVYGPSATESVTGFMAPTANWGV
jgi:hypothetical protein